MTNWKTNRRTKRKYREPRFLDVAPSRVRGGHTLSEHFGRSTFDEPHTWSRKLVGDKRKKQAKAFMEQHRKKHVKQRKAEATEKKKPWLDYKPISEKLDEDEITSFF